MFLRRMRMSEISLPKTMTMISTDDQHKLVLVFYALLLLILMVFKICLVTQQYHNLA